MDYFFKDDIIYHYLDPDIFYKVTGGGFFIGLLSVEEIELGKNYCAFKNKMRLYKRPFKNWIKYFCVKFLNSL
jgi:hypothetical protein